MFRSTGELEEMDKAELLLVVIFILSVVIAVLLSERKNTQRYLKIVLSVVGYYALRFGDISDEDIRDRVGIVDKLPNLSPKEKKNE